MHYLRLFILTVIMIFNSKPGHAVTETEMVMDPTGLRLGKNPIEVWSKSVAEAAESIWIATYKLKSQKALDALIKAQRRGVEVRLILDGKEAKHVESLAGEAIRAGLEVSYWPSDYLGELHAKFYLFDQRQVIFGSFNLTKSAEKSNVELLYSCEDAALVGEFVKQWHHLFDSALPVNPSEPGE